MTFALLVLVCAGLMLVGLVGTVAPILPGLPLVWVGALVFFLFTGVDGDNIAFMTAITIVAVIGFIAAIVLPSQRSRAAGAAWSSVALGFVGAIIGAVTFSVIGAIPGGIIGVYLGERLRNAGHEVAWSATKATLRGMGWAFLCQFSASMLIIGLFVPWVVIEAG